MINVQVQIEITTVGDGENHIDSYSYGNSTGIPPTGQLLASLTNNTIVVPLGARGVVIIPQTNTSGGVLKGTTSDSGVSIFGFQGAVAALRFPAGGQVTSFIINPALTEIWNFIWT